MTADPRSVHGGRDTEWLPPEALFPDEYSRPVFQMGPYDAGAMARNADIAARSVGRQVEWRAWFGEDGCLTLTLNGREAIDFALDDLRLDPGDDVLIVTTSGSPYISNCVTGAIERRCRWSRSPGPRTRAIFLIHEFGFPARLPSEVAALGLPVIEDCAYALGLETPEGPAGCCSDYVVWSFSKAFPMAYGGLLKSPRPLATQSALSELGGVQAPLVAAAYLDDRQAAFARRRDVFESYRRRFGDHGLQPLFEPGTGVVPHAFVVALADQAAAEAIKPRMRAKGIISSPFYGGGGYFLPNHQALTEAAVEYVVANFMAAL